MYLVYYLIVKDVSPYKKDPTFGYKKEMRRIYEITRPFN